MKYPHLAARIFSTPLFMHPTKLDAIIVGVGPRLLGRELVLPEAADAAPQMFSTRRGERNDTRGYMVVDGVAVLRVSGALVHRTKLDADSTLLLGYNDLAADLEHAMDNPDVHAVLQVFDSPGGEVQGAFEFAERAHALRGKKPLVAIADGMAASAAYLGGSAADELVVTATGYAGSIGVVMRHVDFSRALANEGIVVTNIFVGDQKVDGNPFEPLPAAVRDRFQAEMTTVYDMFVAAVVKHTGLSAEHVRGTQAATYMGQAAVDAGLARRVATTDQLITELAALRARPIPVGRTARATANDKGASMSGTQQGGQQAAHTPAAAPSGSFTQADLDAARAEGAAAERQRITDVRAQSLPGHEALVERLAMDGKTTGPEAAAAVLAAERSARAAAAAAHHRDAPAAAPASPAPNEGAQPSARDVARGALALFNGTRGAAQ